MKKKRITGKTYTEFAFELNEMAYYQIEVCTEDAGYPIEKDKESALGQFFPYVMEDPLKYCKKI
jgi:hypothetical protein